MTILLLIYIVGIVTGLVLTVIFFLFFHFLVSQMTFASDKLYRGYLRRSMAAIASQVKVKEIIPHLPCLTDHDRVGFIRYKELELVLVIILRILKYYIESRVYVIINKLLKIMILHH